MSFSGSFTLSSTRPPSHSGSQETPTSHRSTWLQPQRFICVKASDRRCTKTSGLSGGDKARQDRMWKEAGVRREMRRTSHNTMCTNPKPSGPCPGKGPGLFQGGRE
ncbi:hypothetical protein PBY51_015659 [Eleginops maclovinus]|nr:hypothetical protein PBY51_015659 [Eleginops maclovinus]